MGFTSPLIKQAGLKPNDEESENKVRGVLNQVISEQMDFWLRDEKEKTAFKPIERAKFKLVVNNLKLIDQTDVKIFEDENEVLQINIHGTTTN